MLKAQSERLYAVKQFRYLQVMVLASWPCVHVQVQAQDLNDETETPSSADDCGQQNSRETNRAQRVCYDAPIPALLSDVRLDTSTALIVLFDAHEACFTST